MTAMNETFRSGSGRAGRGAGGGFTLFELLIVIGIIIMVAGLALPTMISMLSAGSDAQAYNMLSGQLMVARALAIQHDTYVGVHVQHGQDSATKTDEELSRASFSAIVWIPPGSTDTTFELVEGYTARRIPGTVAFGEVTGDFTSGSSFINLTNAQAMADFTAFTVVFSPQGEFVKKPKDVAVQLATNLAGTDQLWDAAQANGEEAVRVITIFDHGEVAALLNQTAQQTYLKEHAQFLYVNTYTGRLSSRDTRNE